MSNNQGQNEPAPPPFYLAVYKNQRVILKRDESYANTMKLVKKSFSQLREVEIDTISVSTNLAELDNVLAEISEETWTDVVGLIKKVYVGVNGHQNSTATSQDDQFDTDDDPVPAHLLEIPDYFHIYVRTPTLTGVRIDKIFGDMRILTLKHLIERKCGIPVASQHLSLKSGKPVHDSWTVSDYALSEGSLVVMF